VWLEREGDLPDATSLDLDPRSLLEAIEQTAQREPGDAPVEHPKRPTHEARGPQHLAIGFLGETTFAFAPIEAPVVEEAVVVNVLVRAEPRASEGAPRGPPEAC
jgi:hypothetical protein